MRLIVLGSYCGLKRSLPKVEGKLIFAMAHAAPAKSPKLAKQPTIIFPANLFHLFNPHYGLAP